jgi:hypothetical protein
MYRPPFYSYFTHSYHTANELFLTKNENHLKGFVNFALEIRGNRHDVHRGFIPLVHDHVAQRNGFIDLANITSHANQREGRLGDGHNILLLDPSDIDHAGQFGGGFDPIDDPANIVVRAKSPFAEFFGIELADAVESFVGVEFDQRAIAAARRNAAARGRSNGEFIAATVEAALPALLQRFSPSAAAVRRT